MRIKNYSNGGYSTGSFTSAGGTMTGPLTLSGNPPATDLEAITKSYVDTQLSSFAAEKFSTGTLQVGRLPGFTGSAVSNPGTNVLSLANNGMTAGSYSKVTVNAKGLVTNGFGLSEEDIPSLDWGKIVSGKPTTLAGYGITDGLSYAGGVINGHLTLHADPAANMHVASKQYVDAKIGSGGGLAVGDIIVKSTSVTPSGFLKCNGGELSKTAYPALYAVVGDEYSVTNHPGSGQPWRQQYQTNLEQSADITGWTTGTSLPGALGASQAIVTKNRVYLLGGLNNGAHSSTVYTAPVNADGTLGAWTTGSSLPEPLSYSQAIVTKNRVYLLGGHDGTGGITSTVYTAPINSDGTLGTWTTGTPLPAAVSHSHAIVTKNRVYLLGGVGSNTVYTAPINADGTLGTWTTATPLPVSIYGSQVVVTKNRVYLLGGYISGAYSSAVYTAPINTDGTLGTWTTGTSLPAAISYSQAIVTKNRVYLLGGYNGSSYVNTVYTAPINSDGTLGTWTSGTSLPGALTYSQAIVTKNRVYLLGGASGGYNSTVYTASFSGGLNDYSPYYDGSLQPTDPANFRLPDLTSSDLQGTYSYIKI